MRLEKRTFNILFDIERGRNWDISYHTCARVRIQLITLRAIQLINCCVDLVAAFSRYFYLWETSEGYFYTCVLLIFLIIIYSCCCCCCCCSVLRLRFCFLFCFRELKVKSFNAIFTKMLNGKYKFYKYFAFALLHVQFICKRYYAVQCAVWNEMHWEIDRCFECFETMNKATH